MEGKPTQVFSAFGEAAPTVAPRHGAAAHETRGVLSRFQARYESRMEEEYSLPEYLSLWKRLNADPTVEEAIRNFPIRQPVLWV